MMATTTKSTRKTPAKATGAAKPKRAAAATAETQPTPKSKPFGQRKGMPAPAKAVASKVEKPKAVASKVEKKEASTLPAKAKRAAVAVGETAVGAIAVAASLVTRSARAKRAPAKPD